MKLEELKKVIKPLIKECLKEILFEEKNILSHVIKESISAIRDINNIPLREKRQVEETREEKIFSINSSGKQSSLPPKDKQKIVETKKKLLEVIGAGAYNGVDIFDGTKPLSSGGSVESKMSAPSPLANVDPEDPGVPIDKIFENSQLWGKIAAGNKKKKIQ